MQYKQRCADLEAHMLDSEYTEQPASSITNYPKTPQSSALELAHQHLREIREERITDLDTALRRLDEEKNRLPIIFHFLKNIR